MPRFRCYLSENYADMTEREVKILRNTGAKIIEAQEGFQQRFTRSSCDVVFGGGVLNPQPLTSSVLTPNGFVKIADLNVGDEVCGLENTVQTITHCDREGLKNCVRIELEDGSSAECALDHKWWIIREGQGDSTAIAFELLEHWEICKEKGAKSDVSIFRFIDGKPVPVPMKQVIDIGEKEVACLGVSNSDELYITDDYMITKNCGKAQPLTAGVLTPHGFVSMGDLMEGDTITSIDGKTQKVVRIYEKGLRDTYRVYFADGFTTCCAEHLWRIYDLDDKEYKTITTLEARELLKRHKLCIDCNAPIEYDFYPDDDDLPIDAYTLGRAFAVFREDRPDIIDKHTLDIMRQLGMLQKTCIPDRYLYGSIQIRKDFLRGFIDARTKNFPPGKFRAVSVYIRKPQLRCINMLIHSLGGTTYRSRLINAEYRVNIIMPNIDDYYTPNIGVVKREPIIPRRPITRIFPKGREECRCIAVSHPSHLYLTDYFIPTHNTYAAILMVAEPSLNPKFRAAFTRRNLGNLKQGGGIVDDFKDAYGDYVKITTSENPRVSFPTGAYVDCLHIADEEPDKLMERAKGWQYDVFYMDELTSYQFTTFATIGTRVRGKSDFTGHVFATTNPKRSHWVRKMLDWYIGDDGFIMPERDGVVRYFYQMGETVDDIEWGRTPEEVYEICRTSINQQLKKLGGSQWDYRNLIRSFVFYAGKMSENKASIGNNAKYAAAVAAVGGKRAQQLIEGNWNVDENEDTDAPITQSMAKAVFDNEPCRNGDLWITADLADVGDDNTIALAWDGFHIFDIMIIENSTPKTNFDRIRLFAAKHNIPDTHIIYDGTRAAYMIDYMPDAIPFISLASPRGFYRLQADRLKDECYMRLVDAIQNERLSISQEVGRKKYAHKKIREEYSVMVEFLDECAVVRFEERPNGRKKLAGKKEMNRKLGRRRSMDLLDPCAMRMLPVLKFAYGDELGGTAILPEGHSREEYSPDTVDIYDDATWF